MRLDLSRLSVLIIDDNRFIRHLVVEILRKFRVGKIAELEFAEQALTTRGLKQPDIIVCDWVMEPLSGIDLLRRIRVGDTVFSPHTPVIMLTGQLEARHVLEARNAGVNGYIAKPVTVQGLMNRLVEVIRTCPPP